MKERFFLALGALAASASLLLIGACDGHSWKDTQPLHESHGAHGDDHDEGDDHDKDKAEGDHGGEKKAHD